VALSTVLSVIAGLPGWGSRIISGAPDQSKLHGIMVHATAAYECSER
jgi:hypothetical protein